MEIKAEINDETCYSIKITKNFTRESYEFEIQESGTPIPKEEDDVDDPSKVFTIGNIG